MSKRKRYWEMTAQELAEATRQFDDPSYDPPAVKPTARQLALLRRWRRKRASELSTIAVALEQKLIQQADEYAVSHGVTFSELVSDALRRVIRRKKSA